jgi:hypothetical protein
MTMLPEIKDSKTLTRNPLGIIALFISLIYGFACLVLGLSGQNFPPEDRTHLVYFLIGFPILILLSFVFLVVKHHNKLYAPADFKDERNFFRGFEKGQKPTANYKPAKANDDAIDTLLNFGSVKGLYALYAVYLAHTKGMKFKLEDLESHASLLSEEYTHGFLVGASSLGAFTFSAHEQPFSIPSMNEKLIEKIQDIVYVKAQEEKEVTGSDYLFHQLAAIENAFQQTKKSDE